MMDNIIQKQEFTFPVDIKEVNKSGFCDGNAGTS